MLLIVAQLIINYNLRIVLRYAGRQTARLTTIEVVFYMLLSSHLLSRPHHVLSPNSYDRAARKLGDAVYER